MLSLLLTGFGLATAQAAGGHGEKIEFSEPSTPVVASNLTAKISPSLNRLNPTPNGFKQVQEDLFRPLANSMQPADSMEGILSAPLPQPQQRPAPSKHTRDLMEQRRNWAFTDLNDLYPDPSMEEAMGVKEAGADGKEKKSVSMIEKYLANTEKKGAKDRNQWAEGYDSVSSNAFSAANGYNLMTRFMTVNENLSKSSGIFSSGTSEEQRDREMAGFKNPFATSGTAEDPLVLQRRGRFQHLLDPNLPVIKPVNSLGAVNFDDFAHRASASGGLNNQINQPAAEPHRSSVNPMLGFVDPTVTALHSRVFDDPTARSLGMPNPEPIKVVPVPQTAKSVQKMLDPFAASVMKPKF